MNLFRYLVITVFAFCVFKHESKAQKVLTLDDCISIAMENNIALQQAKNNSLIAKSNQFQALMNFLPTVSASANYTWSAGTNFDGLSGKFVTGSFESSSPGISAGWTVFNGFSNQHIKKSTELDLESAIHGIDEQGQNLRSNVLGLYLAVILDKGNIKIDKGRVKLLEAQLGRERKRESVGVGNMEQVYNFQSQLADEKLTLVNVGNSLQRDMMSLLQTLQIDMGHDYVIDGISVLDQELLSEIDSYDNLLSQSLKYSPGLKKANNSLMAAKYSFKARQSAMLPSLSMFGGWGTQYSSNTINEDGNILPLFDQYKNITNRRVGFRLSVPIFNNFQIRRGTQVAKINMQNAELGVKQAKLDITNAIQSVYLDLISDQSTYNAAIENLVSLNQSYEFVKTRYENGNTDFFTYLESLNNKNRAEIQLANSKYSIVFRKKILDVYKGML